VHADLSAIDAAIYNALASDSALRALMPDGVFWDIAPGADHFVLIARSDGEHMNALAGEDGWDRVTYTVQAVDRDASVVDVNDAAFRIHELLHYGLQDVTAGNYTVMHIERVLPIRYMEVDPQNTAARWQHHGGQYQVMVCPSTRA